MIKKTLSTFAEKIETWKDNIITAFICVSKGIELDLSCHFMLTDHDVQYLIRVKISLFEKLSITLYMWKYVKKCRSFLSKCYGT